MQVQEINIQNMNVELVAQMFKNYRSNVLFHLEGKVEAKLYGQKRLMAWLNSNRQFTRTIIAGHYELKVKRFVPECLSLKFLGALY